MSALQIKNVPPDVHDAVRERAKAAGMTTSQYLVELIRNDLAKGRNQRWFDKLREIEPIGHPIDGAKLIREIREEHDAEIDQWLQNGKT